MSIDISAGSIRLYPSFCAHWSTARLTRRPHDPSDYMVPCPGPLYQLVASTTLPQPAVSLAYPSQCTPSGTYLPPLIFTSPTAPASIENAPTPNHSAHPLPPQNHPVLFSGEYGHYQSRCPLPKGSPPCKHCPPEMKDRCTWNHHKPPSHLQPHTWSLWISMGRRGGVAHTPNRVPFFQRCLYSPHQQEHSPAAAAVIT